MMNLTPSAVSHQINKLESEIGFALFHRSHRKIELTDKGASLLDVVSDALGQISLTIDQLSEEVRTELVINVLPVFSIRWLNPRLLRYFETYPDTNLTIKNSYRVESLESTQSDLAIRWGSGYWPGVTSSKLFDEHVLPALSPKLWKTHDGQSEKDLLSLPLIQLYEGADHWSKWAQLNNHPIPANKKTIRFNDPSAALNAASDGLGVVLAPLSLIAQDLESGALITPFKKPIETGAGYYLVQPLNKQKDAVRVNRFSNWLLDEAKQYQSEFNQIYRSNE